MKRVTDILKSYGIIVHFLKGNNKYIVYSLVISIVSTIMSLVNVITPKYIIDELTYNKRFNVLIIYVLSYAAIVLLFRIILQFLQEQKDYYTEKFRRTYQIEISCKISKMQVEDLEKSNIKDIIHLVNNNQFLLNYLNIMSDILTSIITLIGYVVVIMSFDIWIVLLVICSAIFNALSQNKELRAWKICRDSTAELSRQGIYISNYGVDVGGAKEVRLHQLNKWLTNISKDINLKACGIFNKEFKRVLVYKILTVFVYIAELFYSYLLLCRDVINSKITVGSYTTYITTIVAFTNSLNAITQQFSDLKKNGNYLADLRKILEISETTNDTSKEEKLINLCEYTIEFKNVWFKYPRMDSFTLKNINFCIKSGEKVSIVGANGSGKTTLIKLLCRFYKPSKGKITLNGVDIQNIPIEEYIKNISAIFQDYKIFAFSIADNIQMGNKSEFNKVENLIHKVGLDSLIDNFPNGINTYVFQLFDDDGVELSGGEQQKIILLRSLYKDSPIMILDEPTAKLDAIMEYDFYNKFNDMTTDKSVIFISHRLSGSLFCKKIFVMQNGRIVQKGNHKSLMQSEGLYREMFRKQAEGYVDE